MSEKDIKESSSYFRPISEDEMKQWRAASKSVTTQLFEDFLSSSHKMVEVDINRLPLQKHKDSKITSTRADIFASSFYAWKRKRSSYFESLGIDILLIRRGEKIALKRVRRDSKK